MKLTFQTVVKNAVVILIFIVASLAYFNPVLQGKAIFQSDIAQYKGMAKERDGYKRTTGVESYWTNSAFGGMPTYQLGANYPNDYVKKLDRLIRFLPRPADYLFLYLLGFYLLMLALKVDYRIAVLGSLAFGFSTYLIIILGVGHNAKAHALGYIPMVLAGIVLTFRKKYILGFLLTAVAMALEISANHYQMTYYFMLLVLILGAVYLVNAIKEKKIVHYFSSVGLLILAVGLAIATNATGLLATKQYADWSTRGKSELTINADGSKKVIQDGLDKEYITTYSYGITESLNLFIPRLFGGSNGENLGKDSEAYEFLTSQGLPPTRAASFTESMPLYWGNQPIVAGPAYLGATVLFLFVLGLFLVKNKNKWWLLLGALMALFLSWGKNFPALTNFMIDYFPLYNKFRAVSSIQVVLELCVPALGILGLKQFLRKSTSHKERLDALKWTSLIMVGLAIILFLVKGMFSFESQNDIQYLQYFGDELMEMIRLDRKAVYTNDTLRSLIFVLLTAAILWVYTQNKLKKSYILLVLGILILVDLVGIATRYVNTNDFVRAREVERPFQASALDEQIQQDNSVFRVFDPSEGVNGARTSYFHKSIGGYHAAKPKRLQDLFEFHLYNNNLQVLNMLNVKYIVQEDEQGKRFPAFNDATNGPAWFVTKVKFVTSADEEIQALSDFNSKTEAIVNQKEFPKLTKSSFEKDSLASVSVIDYRPDVVKYQYSSRNEAFLVFSEMHYKDGWQSFIDGKPVPHFRVNYTLRGMRVPEGEHEIEFKFEPEVVQKGSQIALASNIVLGVLLLAGIVFGFVKTDKKKNKINTEV